MISFLISLSNLKVNREKRKLIFTESNDRDTGMVTASLLLHFIKVLNKIKFMMLCIKFLFDAVNVNLQIWVENLN